MGKKDIRTVDYLSKNEYFADMFNASCFRGRKVILPEQLEDTDKELKDPETKKGEEVRHDNVKYWKHGVKLAALILEDQSNIDYHMVLRNLYAEGLYYRKQWKEKKAAHLKTRDLLPGPEFISGMKKEEKYTPAVYLVVYLGKNKWDGPRTLYELLDWEDGNEQLKPLINDYKLNIFDYHDYDDFEMFESELCVVFEFLRYLEDKETLRKMIATHSEKYYNVSDETYELIAELTNSKELLKNSSNHGNGEEGGLNNMGNALWDIREEGIEIGRSEGLEIGRSEGLEIGRSEGLEIGRSEGLEIGRIRGAIELSQEWGRTRAETISYIMKKFSLEEARAEDCMAEYWKES